MKHLLLATTAAALLALAPVANAATILTFGQSGNTNTVTGTGGAGGTTFGANDIAISITQILNSSALPGTFPSAFLDITASNISGAVSAGGAIVQHFSGTFSINSLASGLGTNYLSGTFSDGAITAAGATGIAVFAPLATFSSDVITTLGLPRSLSLALTNVNVNTGGVTLENCIATPSCSSGQTIGDFTASIGGNASAAVAEVPEPVTLAVLGVGLLGLAVARRRVS